jgi:hypothetical protein
VWNLLDDLEKTTGGGAEAGWQQANPITQFDIDKDLKVDTSDPNLKAMQTQIDELVHNLRRYIRTRGVTMNTRPSTVHDFGTNADAILSQIAGTIKVPKRILIGAESGELASSQDRSNFAERVGDRRAQIAKPVILRPFMQRIAATGAIQLPSTWDVKWPEIRNATQTERATVAVQASRLNDPAAGIIRVTTDEVRAILGLEPLTDDQLKREAELMQQMDDAFPEPPVDPNAIDGEVVDPALQLTPEEKDDKQDKTAKGLRRRAPRGLPSSVLGEEIDWHEEATH